MTWYQIYRQFCEDMEILFPLKQSDMSCRQNPIPNNLEFHKRNSTKKEVDDNTDIIAHAYYYLYKEFGSEVMYNINHPLFSINSKEYPDREINLSTVLSVLRLSGYSGDKLVTKAKKFINKYKGDTNNGKQLLCNKSHNTEI